MPDPLDQAQQASAASIPALRAVRDAAAILRREVADNWANDVPDIRLRKVDPKALMLAILSDLTALADACERLAEENERMREGIVVATSGIKGALCFVADPADPEPYGVLQRVYSHLLTILPAPAGKGEG